VNTIKKFKLQLIIVLLFTSKSLAFSPEYEKEMYIGCYSNSKAYIGAEGAKKYCLCTINKLSEKFSNDEIDLIFKKTPEAIMKATEFASTYCENNK
tara:strand:- start:3 stop:290 length:288 start_codon:yes stop_codon:yes gene_type:complete